MFEMDVPGDLLGAGGKPDLKKVLQFVVDDIKSREGKGKRGAFGKTPPPRYRNFTLADALPLLNDPEVLLDTCWSELAPELAEHIYLGMLKRPADAGGKAALVAKIHADRSLVGALQAVVGSQEFKQKQVPAQAALTGPAAWVDQASRIAARYGKANASLQDLLEWSGPDGHLGALHRRLWAQQPTDWTQKKVLLFGAFGNGNVGDAYQALAMREHVHRSMGVPLDHIFACSVLDRADYPFPPSHKRPAANLLNTEALNHFGMLVVGGGGLLAHPHEPLLSPGWVSRLTLPVVLAGVGADVGMAPEFAPLARLAMAASGRDEGSLNAFSQCGVTADLVPDAIASVADAAALMAQDTAMPPAVEAALAAQGVQAFDWLWVIKFAANAEEQAILDQVRRQIDGMSHLSHCVVAIEPALDEVLQDQFPEVKLLSSLNRLWPLLQRSSQVCTMRFHGGIFALLQDKPVVGCAQVKLKLLAQDWGACLTYADSAQDLPSALQRSDVKAAMGFADGNAMRSAMGRYLARFASDAQS